MGLSLSKGQFWLGMVQAEPSDHKQPSGAGRSRVVALSLTSTYDLCGLTEMHRPERAQKNLFLGGQRKDWEEFLPFDCKQRKVQNLKIFSTNYDSSDLFTS